MLARRYELQTALFDPSALLGEHTGALFFGVKPWIMAYDLKEPRKLFWEDYTEPEFRGWRRYEDFVLISAEVEFAAYDLLGRELWTRAVTPPWSYSVNGGFVHLNSDGATSRFPLGGQ